MYIFGKRSFDIAISLLSLLIMFPLFIIISILIKLDSRGPIIFKQQRLGLGGRPFYMYKFRSMCVGAESKGSGVYSYKGDTRVTKVGRILRATSLDELPQLYNILIGDMSLIGPRPVLTYHPWTFDKYSDYQKLMFNVRPGLTGWAQVNGRKDVPWTERINMNVYYVENVSFAMDFKIFWMTVFKVLTNADNSNTQETK